MLKLNKNGWGLQTELLFILIFLVGFAVALIGLNRMGLLGNSENRYTGNETNYKLLEDNLKEAAKDYIHEIYSNIISEDTIILRVNHLIKNKYLEPIRDKNGKDCSGYVEVIKTESNNIIYYPYLKCNNYTTLEYDERKDW